MSKPKNGSTDIEDFIEKYESKYMVYVDERGNKWWNPDCVLKLIALLYQHQMKNKNNQKKTKSHTLSLNTASKSKNIPVLVRVGDTVYVDFVPKEIAKVQLEKSEKKERLTTDKTQTGINSLEFELRTIKKFKTFKSMMKELNELNRKYKKEKTKGNITISLPIRGNL